MTNEFLDAALAYARRGWPVLPLHTPTASGCSCGRADCQSIGKHPRTLNGVKDATTDEAKIQEWWARWPDANVAIATGAASGLAVLDVDPRNGGDKTLAALVARYGALPATLTAMTGGGGKHLVFSKPGGLRGRTVGPGLELKGDGGYIVAAPSLHKSGQRYAWDKAPLSADVAPLPDWLADGNGLVIPQTPPVKPLAERVAAVAPEGARHTTLVSILGSLRRADVDYDAALEMARAWNVAKCAPPLSDDEVETTVADIYRRYAPEPARGNGRWQEPVPPADSLTFISARELMAMDLPEPEWVVDGLIPPGLTFIAGKSKIGKSWLALQLARAVARGGEFLGRKVRQGAVLYLALEDGARRTRKRTKVQGWDENEAGGFRFEHFSLAQDDYTDALQRAVSTAGARLVVIDSLKAAMRGARAKENEAEIADLIYPLSQLGQDYDCAVVVVHHYGKLVRDDPGLDLRGSSALFAACDAVIGLYRERGENLAKMLATGRDYEDEVNLALEFANGLWAVAGDAALVETTRAERRILDALASLGEASAEEIAATIGVTRQAVSARLSALSARGVVQERQETLKRGGYCLRYSLSKRPPQFATVATVATDEASGRNGSNGSKINTTIATECPTCGLSLSPEEVRLGQCPDCGASLPGALGPTGSPCPICGQARVYTDASGEGYPNWLKITCGCGDKGMRYVKRGDGLTTEIGPKKPAPSDGIP